MEIKAVNTYSNIYAIEAGVVESPWAQATFSANNSYGTLSTDLSAWGDSPLWHIFDNSNSTKFGAGTTSGGYILWELPLSLKITEFSMVQTTETTYLDRFPQDVILYGSNNGTDFTEVGSKDNYSQPTSGGSVSVNCEDADYYTYYKWVFDSTFGGTQFAIAEINITALKQVQNLKGVI